MRETPSPPDTKVVTPSCPVFSSTSSPPEGAAAVSIRTPNRERHADPPYTSTTGHDSRLTCLGSLDCLEWFRTFQAKISQGSTSRRNHRQLQLAVSTRINRLKIHSKSNELHLFQICLVTYGAAIQLLNTSLFEH
ncbi:hypothetical protein QTP88_016242 [Uroleucon formosanum]